MISSLILLVSINLESRCAERNAAAVWSRHGNALPAFCLPGGRFGISISALIRPEKQTATEKRQRIALVQNARGTGPLARGGPREFVKHVPLDPPPARNVPRELFGTVFQA